MPQRIRDVPGIQHLRRPSVRVAVPGAQVQHGQEQGQLVRRGAAAGVDDLQQPLGEPHAGVARAGLIQRHS